MMLLKTLFSLVAGLAQAGLCPQWGAPEKVGSLDVNFINEASGLAVSRQFADRLYHNNDSGNGPYFYVTNLSGAGTRRVSVSGMQPWDVEDISVGPCGSKQCVFLADIGDNAKARASIDVWRFPEVVNFPAVVSDAEKISLRYPDRAHDAESLAVHPLTGDIYILTKEADYDRGLAYPAMLFRLRATDLAAGRTTLERVATVDIPFFNAGLSVFGQIATSMDFSPTGDRLLVLTYENTLEISVPALLAGGDSRAWRKGIDVSLVGGPRLTSQQEAVAFSADGRSFYFNSEFNPPEDKEAPLFRVWCQAPFVTTVR